MYDFSVRIAFVNEFHLYNMIGISTRLHSSRVQNAALCTVFCLFWDSDTDSDQDAPGY
jgi:hypothetical protein